MLPGSAQAVDHLVFTDGVASVSVFVEHQETVPQSPSTSAEQIPVAESATVGSSRPSPPWWTATRSPPSGEVPPATVRFIANQVKAQAGTARRASLTTVAEPRLSLVHRHDCELCDQMLAANWPALRRARRCRPWKWSTWTRIRLCCAATA